MAYDDDPEINGLAQADGYSDPTIGSTDRHESADYTSTDTPSCFIEGVCKWCEQDTLIFRPGIDDAGICEECWLGMK